MKVLILASNPRKDLSIDREIRDLREVIEKSHSHKDFEVADALAVRVADLQQLLFRYEPQIVHFCGHGSGQQGLVFQDDNGKEQWVRSEALSELFRLFSSSVECVLLNACYSEMQANAIVNHINYVVGMKQEIQDNAAIAFSKGFYQALGYNRSIEQAFEFGRNAIQLEISGSSRSRSAEANQNRKAEVVDAIEQTPIPEHIKPVLKVKSTLSVSTEENRIVGNQAIPEEIRTAIQLAIDKSLRRDANNYSVLSQESGFPSKTSQSRSETPKTSRLSSKRKTALYYIGCGCLPLSIMGITFGSISTYQVMSGGQGQHDPSITLSNGRVLELDDLKKYLEEGDLQNANKETGVLLLDIANLSGNPRFEKGDSSKIDCQGLEEIDKLWAEYSDGKFGINVQKNILLDVQTWERFIQKVEWEKNGQMLEDRSELTYDFTAPKGHLPGVVFWITQDSNFYEGISCSY